MYTFEVATADRQDSLQSKERAQDGRTLALRPLNAAIALDHAFTGHVAHADDVRRSRARRHSEQWWLRRITPSSAHGCSAVPGVGEHEMDGSTQPCAGACCLASALAVSERHELSPSLVTHGWIASDDYQRERIAAAQHCERSADSTLQCIHARSPPPPIALAAWRSSSASTDGRMAVRSAALRCIVRCHR